MNEMEQVRVEGLAKTYPGGIEAVKGIDFTVERGEVFGLLGPNGAGKSTTIGMLATTVAPTSGRAWLGGYDVARQPLEARAVSSVVFQDAVVDRALSGRANLELHARLWNVPGAVARRRRLEIARALVSAPQVLFLDEPTVGLDPRIRHELLDVIAGLRAREDMTILTTTHYLDEAQRLCDRVAIVHQGSIVALDSPGALLADLGREILEFRVAGNTDAALGALRDRGVAGADAFAVGARVTVPLHRTVAAAALAAVDAEGLRASEISTRMPTLDDVYLRLTGDRIGAQA